MKKSSMTPAIPETIFTHRLHIVPPFCVAKMCVKDKKKQLLTLFRGDKRKLTE